MTEQEMQGEIQKQLRMMPGQEKMLQEYYQSNPSVLGNLRGQLYEEKIIEAIKSKAKTSKKIITKEEAENILKAENEKQMKTYDNNEQPDQDRSSDKKQIKKKTKSTSKKSAKAKKVSKK